MKIFISERLTILMTKVFIFVGVPIRNREKHVKEIANLSLELLSIIKQNTFITSDRHNIRLRIGINTGLYSICIERLKVTHPISKLFKVTHPILEYLVIRCSRRIFALIYIRIVIWGWHLKS